MGNTASLANDEAQVESNGDAKEATAKNDGNGKGTFQLGDSFSLSKNGQYDDRQTSASVFIPRYPKEESDEESDGDETDTYTSTEAGTTSKEDGSYYTSTQAETTIGDISIVVPNKNQEQSVDEGSLQTDMAADGDGESTVEERRIGRRAATLRKKGSGEEESIQILDAEEEFSHIMTQDHDENLMLRKARHQHQAKTSSAKLVNYFQKRRQKEEPPEVMTSNANEIPVVEGIDASEDQNDSMITGPRANPNDPHMSMSEIQNVMDVMETRSTFRPDSSHGSNGLMIVVASSDVEPAKNDQKASFFTRTSSTKDCMHQIPRMNLLREQIGGMIQGSETSSFQSGEAIANDEINSFLDKNGIGTKPCDNWEVMLSPHSSTRILSPRFPTSPIMSDTRMVGEILRVHDRGATTETQEGATTHDIDMKIVTGFVKTFKSFLRKHPRFANMDQSVLDSLRVVKLQKLLITLSEVESELEEFVQSTEHQKKQFSMSYHTKLVDSTRKKASRKIELLRSFDGLRSTSQDLEKNLIWELISGCEARAKREHDLRTSLAKLSMSQTNPLSLLPDAQAPPIHAILWTEEFSANEVKQLQIENAFLRSEAIIMEQKLAHLIALSKGYSWVDAVFRCISGEQMNLVREQHEARYQNMQQM